MSELRVLHVNDDPLVTSLVAALLSREGYAVTSINDPTQAISAVVYENFRVVILDIEIPIVDGLQLLQDIKRHDGGIQVVMLTGVMTTSAALEGMRLGASDCVFKPLDGSEKLLAAVADSFATIDRWRTRLRELAQRRKAERQLCDTP